MSTKIKQFLFELFLFGLKEAWSCLFAGLFLILLIITHFYNPTHWYRGDILFIGALSIQALLLIFKYETFEEVKIIFIYHLIGTMLEIYKIHIGSWQYLDVGFFSILGAPLFSGFMYSAIGSYLCRAWDMFSVSIKNYPPFTISTILAGAIYVNFFTNHFLYDIRYILLLAVIFVYRKSVVEFVILTKKRYMPLPLSFALIAFFIWIMENIATYLRVWVYPNQSTGWAIVSTQKITSWTLLVILSFIIVWRVKKIKQQ